MLNSKDLADTKEQSNWITSSGSQQTAWENFKRMMFGSRAYQKLIEERLKTLGKSSISDLNWEEVPVITKSEFYSVHPWHEILSKESYKDIYTFYRSSGTTATNPGRGFLATAQIGSSPYGACIS